MTIIIPTWLVIVIICVFLFNSFHRTSQLVKGAKAVWPSIKELLNPNKRISINISKDIEE